MLSKVVNTLLKILLIAAVIFILVAASFTLAAEVQPSSPSASTDKYLNIGNPVNQCYQLRPNVAWFNFYRNAERDLITKVKAEKNLYILVIEVTRDGLFGIPDDATANTGKVFAYVDYRDFEKTSRANCIE